MYMDEMKDIFDGMRNEVLTSSEKTRMRNELVNFMSEHPVRAPFLIRAQDTVSSLGEFLASRSYSRFRVLSMAFAVVLFVGIGTSYAAEAALPGDPLYAIKVGVTEPIRGALAVSQAAKAQWNAELVSRRLAEAESLAADNKLTPIARTQIELALNQSVHQFDDNVAALSKENANPVAVASAQSDLEASLAGHEQVLVALTSDDPATAPALTPIVAAVRAKIAAASAARTQEENSLAINTSPAVHAAAVRTKENASQALSAVRTMAAATKDVAASTSADLAMADVREGDQKLSEGEFGKAFATFQSAIRTLQTTQVTLDASERLGKDVSSSSTSTMGITASTTATTTATTTIATSTAASSATTSLEEGVQH